jgi:hypothetical protein
VVAAESGERCALVVVLLGRRSILSLGNDLAKLGQNLPPYGAYDSIRYLVEIKTYQQRRIGSKEATYTFQCNLYSSSEIHHSRPSSGD